MRTTLTLDDDVARLVDDAVHKERRSMKHVVNDALRRALSPDPADIAPYRVVPHTSSILPGFDPGGMNRLADEFEDDAIIEIASGTT